MTTTPLRELVCSQLVRILREERLKRRLSMKVLAAQAGLSQSMISLMERDLRNPTLDTLLRIADVLEVELSEVLAKAKQAAASGKKKR
jgi:transcriptional regulator with XRE-family HTH domain